MLNLKELIADKDFKHKEVKDIKRNRDGHISFFANFNLEAYSNKEKVAKWHKFEKKYNGLDDIKLDGGIGMLANGINPSELNDAERKELEENYYKDIINMTIAIEEGNYTEITEL